VHTNFLGSINRCRITLTGGSGYPSEADTVVTLDCSKDKPAAAVEYSAATRELIAVGRYESS
jgi:hypothetical protein